MSLCQSKGSSCGACCGIFNIDYPHSRISKILEERTSFFLKNVDYSKRETVISYREEFENKENSFPKKDLTIYNCPFLGFIEPDEKRVGCMIHPIKTGDPKSQNYSFYGASICQSYDCKNKERSNSKNWEELLNFLNLSYRDYSQLAGDHILITRIEDFFRDCEIREDRIFSEYRELVKKILLFKLNQSKSFITSFEIDMDSSSTDSSFKRLLGNLELTDTDELFSDLEGLKKKPTANEGNG